MTAAFDPRERLLARARELEREIALGAAPEPQAPPEVADQKDEAAEQALREVEDAGVERDLAELHEIELALARLADGRYGRCVDCDEPIGAARLTAQPAALRCIACQRAAEHGVTGG